MNRIYLIFLVGMTMLASGLANAHPRKETETTISFNARSGKTEIVHKFRLIDAETALGKELGQQTDLLVEAEAQLTFEDYVHSRFSIRGANGPVPLTLLGSEYDEGSLWVYQETGPLPREGVYVVRDTTLMETFPQQVNIVYLNLGEPHQTFILTRTSPWEAFRLDGQAVY